MNPFDSIQEDWKAEILRQIQQHGANQAMQMNREWAAANPNDPGSAALLAWTQSGFDPTAPIPATHRDPGWVAPIHQLGGEDFGDPWSPWGQSGQNPFEDPINAQNAEVDNMMAFNQSVFSNQPQAPSLMPQPSTPSTPSLPVQQPSSALSQAPSFNYGFGSTDTSLSGNPFQVGPPSFMDGANSFNSGFQAPVGMPSFVNMGGSLAPSLSLGNNFDGSTNPFNYENPYQGPAPTPPEQTFGGNRLPELDVSTDPTVIGSLDPATGLPIRHNPDPVQLDPRDTHPTNPMGPNNPTIYGGGQGGLLGTGLDIGIPGLISIGGLMGAGGGLLGLGGSMGGLFGGGGGQTNNNPPLIPPVMGPTPDPQPPQQNQPEEPITVPPIIPGGGQDQSPQPVTLPPPISRYPEPNPPSETAPPPTTIPPLLTGGNGPINDHPQAPITIPPILPPTGGPENPTPPTTVPPPINTPPIIPPVINNGGGGGGSGPLIPPTTMPLPLDRNYYREGNQTNQDNSALLPGIFSNYQNYSGGYGQTDQANFRALLGALGIDNSTLTGFANEQTASGNTALRTGNVTDAENLGTRGLSLLQQLNPNMYGALSQANTTSGTAGTPSDIQMLLEQQAREGLALGGSLSAEDNRLAQQAAREAWSARGLVNSNGAVADEVLNRDALARQRMAERQALAAAVDQQGFAQRQQGFGNQVQNSLLQMQGAFNPFQTITSANTQNQGSNQQLFSQGAGFSSGAFGNQNVNQLVNPFSPYAQDVYSSNFNAANARYISQGNNQAALAGARDAASGDIANSFLRLIGSIYGAS